MKVEDKKQIVPGKAEHLLGRLHQHQIGYGLIKDPVILTLMDHIMVEIIQPLILQKSVILQTPLTAAVMETPAVAFPRKIDPFGMTKFIAHEVQVA